MWLLNQPSNDLSNAIITKWLSYLLLFDFDATYLPEEKNRAADALSRRGWGNEELEREAEADDADDNYFGAQIYGVFIEQEEGLLAHIYNSEAGYEGEDLLLGRYLETLKWPHKVSQMMNIENYGKPKDSSLRMVSCLNGESDGERHHWESLAYGTSSGRLSQSSMRKQDTVDSRAHLIVSLVIINGKECIIIIIVGRQSSAMNSWWGCGGL